MTSVATLPAHAGRSGYGEWWSAAIADQAGYRNPRFQTLVLTTFAVLGLTLTALGVFGAVAFLVATRTREMGVRLALGAQPRSLVRLVVWQALAPVAIGILAGLVATRGCAPCRGAADRRERARSADAGRRRHHGCRSRVGRGISPSTSGDPRRSDRRPSGRIISAENRRFCEDHWRAGALALCRSNSRKSSFPESKLATRRTSQDLL